MTFLRVTRSLKLTLNNHLLKVFLCQEDFWHERKVNKVKQVVKNALQPTEKVKIMSFYHQLKKSEIRIKKRSYPKVFRWKNIFICFFSCLRNKFHFDYYILSNILFIGCFYSQVSKIKMLAEVFLPLQSCSWQTLDFLHLTKLKNFFPNHKSAFFWMFLQLTMCRFLVHRTFA